MTATDGDVDVLELLRYNTDRNRVVQRRHRHQHHRDMVCRQLIWGRSSNLEDFPRYPVILAADVFYAHKNVEPLWETVDGLLQRDGSFLLAFCLHKVPVEAVLEAAARYGFTWSCPKITEDEYDDEYDEDRLGEEAKAGDEYTTTSAASTTASRAKTSERSDTTCFTSKEEGSRT